MNEVADSPTVYVGSHDGTVYAIDAGSGEKQWGFDESAYPIASSPTVHDGIVYVGAEGEWEHEPRDQSEGGTVYAIDAASGELVWEFTEPMDAVSSSPTVHEGTVYVGADDGTVYALDSTSGDLEWEFTEPEGWVVASVAVADGTLYVGAEDATVYAIDAATGETVWEFTEPPELNDDPSGINSSPTVVDGTVYVGSDRDVLYAIDAATGELAWAFEGADDDVDSSPTVADGTVYVGSIDGRLYAVDAATGDPEWASEQFEGAIGSSPTVFDGVVYVGTAEFAEDAAADRDDETGTVLAIDAATGETVWEFTEPSWFVTSSPTVVADPAAGHSVDTRVQLGTFGSHDG